MEKPKLIERKRNTTPWTWGAVLRWGVFLWVAGFVLGLAFTSLEQARIGMYDPFAQPGFWSDVIRILF